MNQDEVVVLYEYAAALMPNDGKWNKPETPAQIVAHAHALRNVSFEAGCFASEIVMTRDGKWPAPFRIIQAAKELDPGLDDEHLRYSYGPEMDASVAVVTEVTKLTLASRGVSSFGIVDSGGPAQLESVTGT
jgi:hypothetical protein